MSSQIPDCTSCGACCFGSHDRYIAILPEDAGRAIPRAALTEVEGHLYMTMKDGHCAQLTRTADNRLVCAIYENRPEACRAFRAGSFECGRSRHHRLGQAEALRVPALPPNAIGAPVGKAPGAVPEAELPPAHVVAALAKGRTKPPA